MDIYFPKLKLAIQINGIVHYKPIYGLEKFQRIKEIDSEKRKLCKELTIDLIEIDVSQNQTFESMKNSKWKEVQSLIEQYGSRYGTRTT